jgi:phage terminase Nu1 subunit (DNA packaging protein)
VTKTDDNDPIVSGTVLGTRWGVTARHVTELAKKGIAIRADGGGYRERASTLRYIESLRKTAAGRSGIADERKRVLSEQADKLALANGITRSEWFRATEVVRVWSETFREVSAKMLAITDRLASRLPHLTRHDLHEIDAEIRIVLTEASESYDPKRDHAGHAATATHPIEENDNGEKD